MTGRITLIGVDQAAEGHVFRYVKPLQICSECKIKNVCFNLEQGKLYRIVEVRDKVHPCNVFNKNSVSTVKVEEVEEPYLVEYTKRIIEGSTITLKGRKCEHLTCPNIEKCNMIHHPGDLRITIKSIGEKVNCPLGYDIRVIEGKRA